MDKERLEKWLMGWAAGVDSKRPEFTYNDFDYGNVKLTVTRIINGKVEYYLTYPITNNTAFVGLFTGQSLYDFMDMILGAQAKPY